MFMFLILSVSLLIIVIIFLTPARNQIFIKIFGVISQLFVFAICSLIAYVNFDYLETGFSIVLKSGIEYEMDKYVTLYMDQDNLSEVFLISFTGCLASVAACGIHEKDPSKNFILEILVASFSCYVGIFMGFDMPDHEILVFTNLTIYLWLIVWGTVHILYYKCFLKIKMFFKN